MSRSETWMLQLQEADKKLVEMVCEYAESDTYNGTVREALIFYLEQNGGGSGEGR